MRSDSKTPKLRPILSMPSWLKNPLTPATLRNIGQRQEILSCLINYSCANAMQPTNQGEFESLRVHRK